MTYVNSQIHGLITALIWQVLRFLLKEELTKDKTRAWPNVFIEVAIHLCLYIYIYDPSNAELRRTAPDQKVKGAQ